MTIENVARKFVYSVPWIFCCYANISADEIFFLDVANRTWDESNLFCDSLQLRMITLHTENKYRRLVTFLHTERVTHKIWLGLRLPEGTEKEADFRWVDGKPIYWIDWDDDDPNGLEDKKCISLKMDDNALYDTKSCTSHYFTVCEEKDDVPPTTTNLRRSSFIKVSSTGIPSAKPFTIIEDLGFKTQCASRCIHEDNCVEFSIVNSRCYLFSRYGRTHLPCDVNHKCKTYRRKGVH